MGQQRRRHTAAFKAQVAVAALKEQQTLNEVAASSGVPSSGVIMATVSLVRA
jgi:transposase-like protein